LLRSGFNVSLTQFQNLIGHAKLSDTDRTPDQNAAHEFMVELRTRIATQRLPYQQGVEARALESLYELFKASREIARKYPGCRVFVDTVVPVLNGEIRPVTAKWHKELAAGRLGSRDGGDDFRGDLLSLRGKLCDLEKELRKLAYGEAPPPTSDTPLAYEHTLVKHVDSYLKRTEFRIVLQGLEAESELAKSVEAINASEGQEVANRRAKCGIKTNPNYDAVGLALSGGGIRSATFCLGVVQVLAEINFFKDVDFLSTVSGGGYAGSFLTSRIGSGAATYADIANPHGPDTNVIAFVRQHAKYLSANLRQRWGMATASLAGMLLNWCAPFFVIAVFALVAVLFGESFDLSWWQYVFSAASGLSVLTLLLYAYAMRWTPSWARRCGRAFGLSVLATLVICGLWALHVEFYDLYCVFKHEDGRRAISASLESWRGEALGAGSILAALPTVMRILPVFKNPKVRENVLKVALVAAAIFVPFCALILLYLFCAIGVTDVIAIAGWKVPGISLLGGLTAFFAIVSFFLLNVNLTAPHRLYRDQLAKTFIARFEGDEKPRPLSEVNASEKAPYHLINAALNLPSSDSDALRDRKCDFFLMSKHWCGSPATGYARTTDWRMNGTAPDLASAMAISGAAVSSRMGLGTMPTLSALLTFFNARLGFWIKNPLQKTRLPSRIPGFTCLLREMFGYRMSETDAWLNLTDGGHIENMGAYELLRRRCKFIICVDGEADPDFTFPGLMTLVRHARIDFGVEIDVRLDDIRPNPTTRLSQSHWGLFRVRYPVAQGAPEAKGLLLYIKLSVTGNESELIRRYRTVHPEFPHQSTLDQFFDQEQFEAYRQLGVHVCEGLFLPALMNSKALASSVPTPPATIKEWFERLAYSTF
jgi:hypothetical protein